MKKQINIKLILLESVALIFLINGLQRLYMASQGLKYDALLNENWDKFKSLTSESLGDFFAMRAFWTLGFISFGIIAIGVINWKKGVAIINSIILFIIILGVTMTGFFLSGITNNYLNYFCGIFTENYGTSFFVGGNILTIIGIVILWKTINLNKNTIHNTV